MSLTSRPGNQPSLVGRDRELSVLREHLTAALTGHGSLVLIGGEAGIGKTALAETLCRQAAAQGARVLTGRCFDLTETPAYGPWLYLFERYRPGSTLPPHPDAFAERGVVGEVASQAALFRQVLDFLEKLTVQQPVVVLLDDLHWADPVSLDLLRFLTQSVTTLRLLIVVLYRADELTRRDPLYSLLPVLVREGNAQRLDLRALADEAVHALVSERYHLPQTDTDYLVAQLQARAEGNALFLIELLRSFEERGDLQRGPDGWQLGAFTEVSVPPLLRQVIDARVARLDGESQRLLAVAAIIGHFVPCTLWTAVSGVDEETLLDIVSQAESAHVMVEHPDGTGATFIHALVREAVYESVRPSQRRRWHRVVGETLAAMPNTEPDIVANHFRRAGDSRVVDWLTKAGERAASVYAWATAADRFEAALKLLGTRDTDAAQRGWLLYRLSALRRWDDPRHGITLLEEAVRLATLACDSGLAAYAVYTLGTLRCSFGEMRRGVADMETGVAARRVLTAAEQERAWLLSLAQTTGEGTDGREILVHWLATVGRYAEAIDLSERLDAELCDAVSDETRDVARAEVLHGLAQAYAGIGRADEAWRAFARARAVYRDVGHDFMFAMTIINDVRWTMPFRADRPTELLPLLTEAEAALGRVTGAGTAYRLRYPQMVRLLLAGRWDEARQHAMREGESPRGIQHTTRQVLGSLVYAQGDADLAWELVHATLPQGPKTEPGDAWLPCGLTFLRLAAALCLDAGDVRAAQEWLEAHDRWVIWSGSPVGRADGNVGWAAYYRAMGDLTAAHRKANAALALAASPQQPLVQLAAHRLLGELDTDASRFDDAKIHLDAALALADACAAPYERALTLLAHAERHAAMKNHTDAQTVLAQARAICEPLGAKLALARVDTLATQLAVPHATTPTYPAGLTAREVDVLRLIATGKTNREIADALFLSPATVSIHITHILSKTDTTNRTEAAAFALRHSLDAIVVRGPERPA